MKSSSTASALDTSPGNNTKQWLRRIAQAHANFTPIAPTVFAYAGICGVIATASWVFLDPQNWPNYLGRILVLGIPTLVLWGLRAAYEVMNYDDSESSDSNMDANQLIQQGLILLAGKTLNPDENKPERNRGQYLHLPTDVSETQKRYYVYSRRENLQYVSKSMSALSPMAAITKAHEIKQKPQDLKIGDKATPMGILQGDETMEVASAAHLLDSDCALVEFDNGDITIAAHRSDEACHPVGKHLVWMLIILGLGIQVAVSRLMATGGGLLSFLILGLVMSLGWFIWDAFNKLNRQIERRQATAWQLLFDKMCERHAEFTQMLPGTSLPLYQPKHGQSLDVDAPSKHWTEYWELS